MGCFEMGRCPGSRNNMDSCRAQLHQRSKVRYEAGREPKRQLILGGMRRAPDPGTGPIRQDRGFRRQLRKPAPDACCQFLRLQTWKVKTGWELTCSESRMLAVWLSSLSGRAAVPR